MEPPIDINAEAIEDFPEALQQALYHFMDSKTEENLSSLIREALNDFSDAEIAADLPDDANFIKDLGLDSLAITEFVFFFEDIFNLKITNEELVTLTTLGELKRFLFSKLCR